MVNNSNFDQLLQTIIYALIVFVIPGVGYFLSNYLHQTTGNVVDQRKRTVVENLVRAAEQTLETDPEKRAFVETHLTNAFPGISPLEAHNLIEAAVLTLHTSLGLSTHDGYGVVNTPPAVPNLPVGVPPVPQDTSFSSSVPPPPPSRSNPIT